MTRRGLVLASYGTTRPEARLRDMGPLVREMRESVPGTPFCEAYLSAPVRRSLARQGAPVPGTLEDALTSLLEEGVEQACVQPALIVAGSTMAGLSDEAAEWGERFRGGVVVGEPLLSSPRDVIGVARAIAEAYPARPGRALVLVGHGVSGGTNLPYLALRDELRKLGRTDVFLGLLEGSPGVGEVAVGIRKSGLGTATLVPLMLAAGSHVARQLSGDGPRSWKTHLRAEGIEPDLAVRGLGSLPAIRAIFLGHARAALRS